MHTIDIYRGTILVDSVKLESSSTQNKTVMGDNTLSLSFILTHYQDFKIGDHCTVFGETYILNKIPPIQKTGDNRYSYTMTFQAEGADLAKAQFLFLDATNTLTESDFSLMGNADTFIDLILQNAARVSSGWSKGQVIATPYKNLSFSGENCYNALSRLATEFETEFWIEGKTIHLTKKYRDTAKSFRVGQFKGLYSVDRLNLDNADIVTRLYVYGSDKNLPPAYQNYSRRLRLPSGFELALVSNVTVNVVDNGNGFQTMRFDWQTPGDPSVTGVTVEYRLAGTTGSFFGFTITGAAAPATFDVPVGIYEIRITSHTPTGDKTTGVFTVNGTVSIPVLVSSPKSYIESKVAQYGVQEATKIYDDIYPHRTGKVTAVDASDPFKFLDTSMNFDINAQLMPGTSAKVTFNTGQLSGYTFDIHTYDDSTKTFVLLKNKTERSLDVPSTLLRPAIGDEYVLVDIVMPQSYIDAAENELLSRASADLSELCEPQLSYKVVTDPAYLKNNNITIQLGDLIWIIDEPLQIQRKIRVSNLTRNLVQENVYDLTLSDIATPGTISRILASTSDNTQSITGLDKQLQNNSILNNNVIGNLKLLDGATLVFDPAKMPQTTSTSGFAPLYVELSSGKIYQKV